MKNYLIASSFILILLLIFRLNIFSQTFIEHIIDSNFKGICVVKVYDLDKDGDLDIIGGSEQTPYSFSEGIAWWRNNGGSPIQWEKFQISNTYLHVMSVDAGYIDNDTFPDIIASSWENGKISWWKNSGDPTQNWTEEIVISGLNHAHDAVLSDLNNNGKPEIIAVSSGDNKISIFYNQSDIIPFWVEEVLTSSFYSAKTVSAVDLNDDLELDIIGSADGSDDIIWWDNKGGSWDANYVTTNFNGSAKTYITDINNDDQYDIIGTAWEGNEVSYWICDDINTNSWTKTQVTNTLEMASSVSGNDIDLDGDIDIIATGKVPGELVIYYNNSFIFSETVINPDLWGGAALAVVDIDDDGDDDIITGAGVYGDLFLYENELITDVRDPEMINNFFNVYPNPVTEKTTIDYYLNKNSTVSLKVFDITGREVKTIINDFETAGSKIIIWQRDTNSGMYLTAGIYFIQLRVNNYTFSQKVIIN